jgi:hypothetical protein
MNIMIQEEWMHIQRYGIPTIYEISNHGRLRKTSPHWQTNIPTTTIVNTFKKKHNYQFKTIKGEKFLLHRLVASAFLSDHSFDMEIQHIDGNIHNNYIENLKMVPRRI